MAASRLFGSKSPRAPHLLTHGLGAEVLDLRNDVEEAFQALELDNGISVVPTGAVLTAPWPGATPLRPWEITADYP